MTTIATYHVRMVNGRATASGEKSSEALASWCATMSQFWLFPRTRGLGAAERNSFRFFPADRFARSNGTSGTEKRQRPKTRLRLPIFTLATDRAPESCVVIVVMRSLRF